MKKFISAISAAALVFTAMPASMPAASNYNNSSDFIFCDTFEGGTDSWTGRGSASVESTNAQKFAGSSSLYVSGRAETWNGAIKELGSSFTPGTEYSFSVNILPSDAKRKTTYHLTLQYNDASGEANYTKIASAEVMGNTWFQLSNESYMIPSDASDACIYVETENGTYDFYIDDAIAAPKGTVISGAGSGCRLIPGDANCDGKVNIHDVVTARKALAGTISGSYSVNNCDVDGDTVITEDDLKNIHAYVMGKITEFPYVGPPEPPPSDFDYNANLQYKAAPDKYINEACPQAGKIVSETYNSINGSKKLNVYLPYGYDESKKYNIFYIMHGGGENENTIFYDKDAKLGNILDHMIMNGELEPMIVVTPTFNGGNCTAQNFYNEFRQNVVPFVESKYSTYAEDTSEEGIRASRMHRAYGGFSMGAVSTWAVMENCLDIVGYFMPLSGDHWSGNSAQDKANSLAKAIDRSGLSQREYFLLAATGTDDIAYPNISPQIDAMKPMTQYYTYTSDFSKGNFYFLTAPALTHWWGYVRHYVYDALPYFFHE